MSSEPTSLETFANAMGLPRDELIRLREEQANMDLPFSVDTTGQTGRVIQE